MGLVSIALLLTVGGVAAAIAASVRHASKRVEALSEVGKRLGWTFLDHIPVDAIPNLDRFELFKAGRSKKITNLLTSPPGEHRAMLFDYRYVTGGGKSQQTHRQTVLYVTSDTLQLPAFSLRPENFFHRIGEIFGFHDIDFDRRPEFSRLFLLRGEDETGLRRVFSDPVLRFFEGRPRTCATGGGSELLFWKPGGFVPADALQDLIRDGEELVARFEQGERP